MIHDVEANEKVIFSETNKAPTYYQLKFCPIVQEKSVIFATLSVDANKVKVAALL